MIGRINFWTLIVMFFLLLFKIEIIAQCSIRFDQFPTSSICVGDIDPTVQVTSFSPACFRSLATIRLRTAFLVDTVCLSFGDGKDTLISKPNDTVFSVNHLYNFKPEDSCVKNFSVSLGTPGINVKVEGRFLKICPNGVFSYKTSSTQITFRFKPNADFGFIGNVCANDSLRLNALGCTNTYKDVDSTDYWWDFGNGTPIDTIKNTPDQFYIGASYLYPTGGTFKVRLFAKNQCGIDSTVYNVNVTKINSLQILTNANLCTGDTFKISISASGNGSYKTIVMPITGGLYTVIKDTTATPLIIFRDPGKYKVTFNYGFCRIDTVFDIDKGADIMQTFPLQKQCFNGNNQFKLSDYYASAALPAQVNRFAVYLLGNPTPIFTATTNGAVIPSNTISLTQPGKYIVKDTSITTCNAIYISDTLEVSARATLALPKDTIVCLQQTVVIPQITNATLQNSNQTPPFNFRVDNPISYNFTYKPSCGNDTSFTITGKGKVAIVADSFFCSFPGIITLQGSVVGMTFTGSFVNTPSSTFDGNAAGANSHYIFSSYIDSASSCTYLDTAIYTVAASQTAAFNFPDTVCVNSTESALVQGTNFVVDWGDTFSNSLSQHLYTATGTKFIQVKFVQASCDTTLYDTVVVIPAPDASFTLLPNKDTVCFGDSICVLATQNPLFDYIWTVDPPGLQTNVPPCFVGFNNAQVPLDNKIILNISSRQCPSATVSKIVVVSPATQAAMALNFDSVCSPVYLTISNNSIVSSSGASFKWYKNNVLIDTSSIRNFYDTIVTNDTPVIITYKLVAFSCGRFDSVSKTITVYPPDFSPAIYADTFNACVYVPFTFSASPIQGCSVIYSFGDGKSWGPVSSFDEVKHFYTKAGKYKVSITMNCACKIKSDDLYVTVNPGPEITVNAPNQTCTDSATQIFAQSIGVIPAKNYETFFGDGGYNKGDSTPYHSYNISGTYNGWMLAIGNNGCLSDTTLFSVNVSKRPSIFISNIDTFVCSNILTYFGVDSPELNTTYEWTLFENGNSYLTSTFDGKLPVYAENEGEYKIVLVAYNNNFIACRAVADTLSLRVFSSPKADFAADKVYVIGEENGFVFTNNSTPANSAFFWDFGDNSYSVLFNPNEKRYSKPDSFNVLLTATYGPCKDSVLKGVRVFPNMKIYIPNTFSPNNDGANDFLELYGNVDDLDHVNIKVFNRLGEKVYESFDKHFHWDGTYNGKTLSPDVFVYTLELSIIGNNKKKMIKGSIALIR